MQEHARIAAPAPRLADDIVAPPSKMDGSACGSTIVARSGCPIDWTLVASLFGVTISDADVLTERGLAMLSYLAAETGFLRAFGNRSLLLVFLCALSRTANKTGPMSALGLSLDLNPGIIVVFGPFLALLLLVALKIEGDGLLVGREAVRAEMSALPGRVRGKGRLAYALFGVPLLTAVILVYEYVLEVVPATEEGCGYDRWRQFYDLRWSSGTPSLYCIRNLREGMPWIYPPFQIYVYGLVLASCCILTWLIARDWSKARP